MSDAIMDQLKRLLADWSDNQVGRLPATLKYILQELSFDVDWIKSYATIIQINYKLLTFKGKLPLSL